jgi:hypothetical protein
MKSLTNSHTIITAEALTSRITDNPNMTLQKNLLRLKSPSGYEETHIYVALIFFKERTANKLGIKRNVELRSLSVHENHICGYFTFQLGQHGKNTVSMLTHFKSSLTGKHEL